MKVYDPINPSYYKRGGIETRNFILAHGLGVLEAQIVKYIDRYTFKDGLQDLLKARNDLNKLIRRYKREHPIKEVQSGEGVQDLSGAPPRDTRSNTS